MTEAEWLACDDPWKMLHFLGKQNVWIGGWRQRLFGWLGNKTVEFNDRKLQMLVIAYCQRHEALLTDERDIRALKISESYVEGLACVQELGEAIESCSTFGGIGCYPSLAWNVALACFIPQKRIADQTWAEYALKRLQHAVASVAVPIDGHRQFSEQEHLKWFDICAAEAKILLNLLHDTIGNPFRPITLNPIWLTPTVTSLANSIYQEKAFDRMPILADALQDAGCDNEDILNHCRQPGEHVRGCFVVDLLTGRK